MGLPAGWSVEDDQPSSMPEGWSVDDDATPPAAAAPVRGGEGETSERTGPAADAPHGADAGDRDAFLEGMNDALPFARDLDAGVLGAAPQAVSEFTTAMAGGSPSWERVLNAYKERKAAGVARGDAARKDHLLPYLAGNLPAGIAAGVATAGAAGPSAAMKGASELALLLGQGENFGEAQPSDVAVPALAGRAIGATGRVGIGVLKSVASALKVPLTVAEELFHRFGATKLAKMIVGSDPTPEGKVISERVAALKGKINDARRFKPEPGPEIQIDGPTDRAAFSVAQDAERGLADFGPGPGDFSADPSIVPNFADEGIRKSLAKRGVEVKPGGEGAAIDEIAADVRGGRKVADKLKAEAPFVDDGLGDHSQIVTKPARNPASALRLKSKDDAWRALKNESGIDDHDSSKADVFYEKWVKGEGPKPPPWQGGEYDEINEILGLKGAKRVSGAREAFDRLMKGAESWGDVQDKIELLRTMPGFAKVRIPEQAQEALLPKQAERSASFAFGHNDPEWLKWRRAKAEVESGRARPAGVEAAAPAAGGRFDWPNEPIGKNNRAAVTDPRRHLRWEGADDEAGKAELWDRFADDSMGMGEADARWRIGEDSRPAVRVPEAPAYERPGAAPAEKPPYLQAAEQRAAEVEAQQQAAEGEWAGVKGSFAEHTRAAQEAFVTKAKKYRSLLQQAQAAESQNRMEAARLRGLADEARGELQQMQRGRRAVEKVAGAVAGWKAGSAGGVLGNMGGAAAGYKMGAPVGLGAEASSVAGQKLGAWAAAHADQWATRGDDLGRIAKWALASSGEPSGLRMFLLGRAARELQTEQ